MEESSVKMTKLSKCAGCGAKVGAGTLAQLLEGLPTRRDERLMVGFDKSDDASVWRINDELALVQTIDFFPPIVDDAYTFGQIAAANALSDVYAMGAEPRLAMNVLCVSDEMDGVTVRALLRGGYEKAYEAGAIITGGHSIRAPEPKYGLSVSGFVHPDRVLTNCAAKKGDVLILTKPLGIGITTTAARAGLADPAAYDQAVTWMRTLNRAARDIMVKFEVHSATDITGFGLLGHSCEMAQGSGVSIELFNHLIPFLPGVRDLALDGLLPEGLYRNREFAQPHVWADAALDLADQDLLYDPQTSGGLLIAVAEKDAQALLGALQGEIPCAQIVGQALNQSGFSVYVRR